MKPHSFLSRFFFSTLAFAAVIFTLSPSVLRSDELYIWAEYDGFDVIFHFEGSIDTTGFPGAASIMVAAAVDPAAGNYLNGDPTPVTVDHFVGVVPGDPATRSFGDGNNTNASNTTGDAFGFSGTSLFLPENYVSGDPIAGTMSFDAETFASMGVDATTPKSFDTTVGTNTIRLMVDPNALPPRSDNAKDVLQRVFEKKIKKVLKKIEKAKNRGQTAKVRNLKRKLKKLRKKLARL